MEDPAASRSPVWGLVKSKNRKPRDEKRDRIPNPRSPGRRLALARGILRAGPDCAQLCRQGAPRQDNKKGQQARAARPSGGSPQPRAVRATLQAHAVLQAHPSQEGHLQGRSRDSFKDGTHHVPNAQEREGVLGMGTTLIFHSGQVFKQRFLYEGSGASGR